MKKGEEIADDKDDDHAVRTRPSDSDTVNQGIVAQHSVYIVLPEYQIVSHMGGRIRMAPTRPTAGYKVSDKTGYFHTIIL